MRKKILIIEDNYNNRLLMKDLMLHHGFDVLEAEDGAKGLLVANTLKPDLIILDIQIPMVDGYDFVKTLREDPEIHDIKIIAVTSYAMKGDREKILLMGANEYVSKPIDTRLFPKIVKKCIES